MNKPAERSATKQIDSIQQRLTSYACGLNYNDLPPEAIHAAKVRIIDALGALIAGFFGEPSRIARNLAVQMPNPRGATIIGTRFKTMPDMAAFVNTTTARYVEMIDSYHFGFHGHPGDVVAPALVAAEHAQVNGREFITGVILGYEVFLRICDVFCNGGFDQTNQCCVGTAVAAGKLLGLSPEQLSHCISMAVVPNNILRQVRIGHLSMFKGASSGQAGRAGIFAALLAQAGMEGPHLPFEGKAGWCDHVAGGRFTLDTMGGGGTPFKILSSQIKNRACGGGGIASVLAAEKVFPLKSIKEVKEIIVEVHKYAQESMAYGPHSWNPESRETADHSIPYLVAVTLMDGTVTPRSYSDHHLSKPELRALIQKIQIVVNEKFTQANERVPQEHHARVTVVTGDGERLIGESGGDEDDLGFPKSDAKIEEKFRTLAEDYLGTKQANAILDRLWHLEEVANVAEIPPALVIG